MHDLVHRLRQHNYSASDASIELCNEAADEIEKLRALSVTLQEQFAECSDQFLRLSQLNAKLLERQGATH